MLEAWLQYHFLPSASPRVHAIPKRFMVSQSQSSHSLMAFSDSVQALLSHLDLASGSLEELSLSFSMWAMIRFASKVPKRGVEMTSLRASTAKGSR